MSEPTPSHASSSSPGTLANPGVSDEQLMLAFSKGSADSFTELFTRYKQPIYGFFRRRVFESAHAEELTQETFLALFGAAARYQPRALFRTYLYAIGFKILRAHRRKAAFRATFFGQTASLPDPGKQDAGPCAEYFGSLRTAISVQRVSQYLACNGIEHDRWGRN
jgi:DNA-directed RNA polymerase specialized sigma24 family protein